MNSIYSYSSSALKIIVLIIDGYLGQLNTDRFKQNYEGL
jgi:hypothetical protein